MIDHYDSFTYNLVDCFRKSDILVSIFRPNTTKRYIENHLESQERHPVLVLSPGPGSPINTEFSSALIKEYYTKIPILGICLGHQIIAHTLGGSVGPHHPPSHGQSVRLKHNQKHLFNGIPENIHVGRYHSLCVTDLPRGFVTSAQYGSLIMAMMHKFLPIFGLQFHPESILTPDGDNILQNFIQLCRRYYDKQGSK